jgi:hypothetical protein
MSHEMDLEDYLVAARRKLAVVEQQNQDLREQNSRLTLALDEALSIARKYRGGNDTDSSMRVLPQGPFVTTIQYGGRTVSKTLVREMPAGAVDLGESFQACPANYSAEDAMAASIVRLECEAEELRAEVALLREQARILAGERDEAIAARKASAADWLNQVERANGRVSRALRQVSLAERERDEAIQDRNRWRSCCIATMIAMGLQTLLHFFG